MRTKTLLILLTMVAICALGIGTAGSKGNLSTRRSLKPGIIHKASLNLSSPQSAGVVDGSVNPELIPDKVAYSMLFRLLSNRHTEEERSLIRSYIRQMDIGDAHALLAVAKEFEEHVGVLDRKAEKIHEENGPNLDSHALAQLNELQQRKDRIVADIVASLPTRLRADDMERLRQHIDERVKPKVKIVPDHIHQ